jgi:hypothetical protein
MQTALRNIVFNLARTAVLFALVIALIHSTGRTYAQSSSSAVNGVVTDPSGAVISDAKVALTDVDTNVERDTVSNATGNYSFTNVPPARYTLTITATGFQTEKISAFPVEVAQVVAVNASLKVGSVNQAVTVEASNTELESSSAQLGTLIGTKEVNDLPLNGRNFTQLLELTPGAAPISVGQNNSSSNTANDSGDQYVAPSINGQSSRSTMYLVDGLQDNNSWYNTYSIPPIIDTIEEFKINSHNDAQYGQVTGGVVNIATKSGSNTPHGSAWEFDRNNVFDAQQYFPAAGTLYHVNQFGAQAGGPIVIPRLYNGHNKTFFEVGFEGFEYSKAAQSYFLQPTAAQLGEQTWGGPQNLMNTGATVPSGDFSSATTGTTKNGSCNYGSTSVGTCQLYDPGVNGVNTAKSNRPAYVGNQIPVSEMDPKAIALIQAIFSAPITIPGIAPTVDNGEITTPSRSSNWN